MKRDVHTFQSGRGARTCVRLTVVIMGDETGQQSCCKSSREDMESRAQRKAKKDAGRCWMNRKDANERKKARAAKAMESSLRQ